MMLEYIAGQEQEVQKWKGEAMGRGNEAVSRSWQGSVDETVRKLREGDACIIQFMQDEIKRLQEKLKAATNGI